MESLASLLGAVALAAPMDAPPPPRTVVVPLGFHFANGKVLPGRTEVSQGVVFYPPPTLIYTEDCRT